MKQNTISNISLYLNTMNLYLVTDVKEFINNFLVKVVDSCGFYRHNGLILSEAFFVCGKEQESRKKICQNRAKNPPS